MAPPETKPRKIELLSPAANASIAIEAIIHGADAVYIGGPSHGARRNASNSIDDIKRVVDFAHIYNAKVYATVNTIIFNNELRQAERLSTDLWRAGVDALIVQDMAMLRLDIPPIALHASTQCDIRTPEKAKFLQDVGFSQLVLARELTLEEIKRISDAVEIPIETFIHGALCVSYSGRCHASEACFSRSANRGECAQICRQPWSLTDSSGRKISREAHFLSLKDFNASDTLEKLIETGVSSFKIEGRLKDLDYVKNVTAFYRQRLDEIIENSGGKYQRSSYGRTEFKFKPQLDKCFNRGFTHYFLEDRQPRNIGSLSTPKSMGEKINEISTLNNGDGISYFNEKGEYTGLIVNGIENGKIKSNKPFKLPEGAKIHRTYDVKWQKMMSRPTAERKLDVDITIDSIGITAKDEKGNYVRIPFDFKLEKAIRPMDFKRFFEKTGNTPFRLRSFSDNLTESCFLPASRMTALRRYVFELLLAAGRTTYCFDYRRNENPYALYPECRLTFADNVANTEAERFYKEHGVIDIESAMETRKGVKKAKKGECLMTTRHCILRELGMCRKSNPEKSSNFSWPLVIKSGRINFTLDFDCSKCEMKVISQ